MPQAEAKKAKLPYKKPTITDLGPWPEAEEKIRERALSQGMPLEEIERLLDKIREARKTAHKTTDAA